MKVSVSLPDPDLMFLDEYSRRVGLASRSAAMHAAVRALRERDLEAAYLAADEEWHASGEADVWDAAIADGLDERAPR
jgi:Arc/MetJ-type ribon-helix-helix transcriptional regulator